MAVTRLGCSPKVGVRLHVPRPDPQTTSRDFRRFIAAADDRVLELNETREIPDLWMVQLKIHRTLYKSPHGGNVTGEISACYARCYALCMIFD